jgi:hypothetical protein
MSLATTTSTNTTNTTTSTTHTDAGLLSRIFNFTSWRTADAEKAVPSSGYAKFEIERIALQVYNNVYNHRYVRIEQRFKEPRFRTAKEVAILDKKAIGSASTKIRLILRTSETGLDNFENRLIDSAIWALMINASIINRGTGKDESAAYVMRRLLFPLKNETLSEHDESLLYMALSRDRYKMGPEVFKAVVSRNDQLLRQWELKDGDAFLALKFLYDINKTDLNDYVAKMAAA